jgi:hypothetical protein
VANKDQIASWIAGRLKPDLTSPLELELLHQRGGRVELFTFEVDETPEELAARIFLAASEDCEGHGGTAQTYWVVLRLMDRPDPLGRKPITVDPRDAAETHGDSLPDQAGAMAQTMRHAEAHDRILMTHLDRAYVMVREENEALRRLEDTRRQHDLERMAMERALAQNVANQRVEEKRLENAAKRQDFLFRQLELLLPVGASALFGRGAEKIDWAHESDLLLKLLMTCESDQLQAMITILDAPSRALLQELIQGKVAPPIVPLAVQRLMGALTEDQYRRIHALLRPEQEKSFDSLFSVRKHSMAWSTEVPGAMARPRYEALPEGSANGVGSTQGDSDQEKST